MSYEPPQKRAAVAELQGRATILGRSAGPSGQGWERPIGSRAPWRDSLMPRPSSFAARTSLAAVLAFAPVVPAARADDRGTRAAAGGRHHAHSGRGTGLAATCPRRRGRSAGRPGAAAGSRAGARQRDRGGSGRGGGILWRPHGDDLGDGRPASRRARAMPWRKSPRPTIGAWRRRAFDLPQLAPGETSLAALADAEVKLAGRPQVRSLCARWTARSRAAQPQLRPEADPARSQGRAGGRGRDRDAGQLSARPASQASSSSSGCVRRC